MFSNLPKLFLAIGVSAALLLCALAIALAIAGRKSGLNAFQMLLLQIARAINRFVWHTKINRPLPIGPDQGAVIIANHTSSVDPLFIQMATNRQVHWLVAREYCVDWRLGWFFRAVGAIPAGRGGVDSAAVKQAIRLASAGKLVGLLPEGRINTTGELLLPGRPGAALVALRARVPVIPCYIAGASYDGTAVGALFKPARIQMTVGDPIDISEFDGREREPGVMEELTKRMLTAIARLAGATDFVPQVAGRRWKPDETAETPAEIDGE